MDDLEDRAKALAAIRIKFPPEVVVPKRSPLESSVTPASGNWPLSLL